MQILTAEGFTVDPEKTTQLLGQGTVMVFGSQSVKKAEAEGSFEVTALSAAAI